VVRGDLRTARLPQRRNRTLLGDDWLARMDEISRGISRSPARATQFHPVDIGQKPLDQTLRAIGGLPHLLLCRSSVHQHARLVGPRSRVGRGICPAGLMPHSVPATSQDLPTSSPRWEQVPRALQAIAANVRRVGLIFKIRRRATDHLHCVGCQ